MLIVIHIIATQATTRQQAADAAACDDVAGAGLLRRRGRPRQDETVAGARREGVSAHLASLAAAAARHDGVGPLTMRGELRCDVRDSPVARVGVVVHNHETELLPAA